MDILAMEWLGKPAKHTAESSVRAQVSLFPIDILWMSDHPITSETQLPKETVVTDKEVVVAAPPEKKAKVDSNNNNNNKMSPKNPRIIAMFDVDGTLTIPRGEITESMMSFLKNLSEHITVGIVGGSDLPKQEEQLGKGIVKVFPYNFSQNGLVAYKDGELLEIQTISKFLGEDNVKRIVNWVMKYLADVDIPVKVSWVSSYCPNCSMI